MSATNRRIRANAAAVPVGYSATAIATLRRMVLASMLFEKQFYVDGVESAAQIKDLIPRCDPKLVQGLAVEARTKFNLRHMPLLLCRELARHNNLPHAVLAQVIQRADELGEFVSLYWQDGKQPLSNQVKRGLAEAFHKFNAYQFAKWDKNSAQVRVRDVMFLSRPKPQTTAEEQLFKQIADRTLPVPDTWEVALSSGADKGAAFTRLMRENKLGAIAFLRNLRNMQEAGVSKQAIAAYAENLDVSKVLPFRFIAAQRVVPQYTAMLEKLMFKALANQPKLPGKTRVIVDVSGSMFGTPISQKSDLERFDAAAALAVLCRELCEEVEVYSFSNRAVRVQGDHRGFALVDAINTSQAHGGTELRKAMREINANGLADRDIVFTDEQSYYKPDAPQVRGYIINVAGYKNGVDHADWNTITGFSEQVFQYISEYEKYSF